MPVVEAEVVISRSGRSIHYGDDRPQIVRPKRERLWLTRLSAAHVGEVVARALLPVLWSIVADYLTGGFTESAILTPAAVCPVTGFTLNERLLEFIAASNGAADLSAIASAPAAAAARPAPHDGDWELLYRASRDGWSSKDFHTRADARGETVTIVLSEFGAIAAGFAAQSWTPTNEFVVQDPSRRTFLATLRNFQNIAPCRMPLRPAPASDSDSEAKASKYGATCHARHTLPCFGPAIAHPGMDLYLPQYCNSQTRARSDLGGAFEVPASPEPIGFQMGFAFGLIDYSSLLGGSYQFLVKELEVYGLKTKS
jgi:hypothetical protein